MHLNGIGHSTAARDARRDLTPESKPPIITTGSPQLV
jgi:hypothetical protein